MKKKKTVAMATNIAQKLLQKFFLSKNKFYERIKIKLMIKKGDYCRQGAETS